MSNPIQFQNTGWATRPILINESLTGNERRTTSPIQNFIYYVKANGMTAFYENSGFDAIIEVAKSLDDMEDFQHLRSALIKYATEIKQQPPGDSHHDNVKIRRITQWIESFVNQV